MFIKYLVGPLSVVLVLGGCGNGSNSSGGDKTTPLTYDQVNTIVQNQNNPEVVRQADFDDKVKYAWGRCKVLHVYVYPHKTVVSTSGCSQNYWVTTKEGYMYALADVAAQAKMRNKYLYFYTNINSGTFIYFVL